MEAAADAAAKEELKKASFCIVCCHLRLQNTSSIAIAGTKMPMQFSSLNHPMSAGQLGLAQHRRRANSR